ncbi:relaxase/mobilization nuclease domain-containing protein [Gluconobacter sp. R75690]|uniref:relaxase/mobilization nuclease domain-containing protein n=1 Tax=unclassified Gluconobacter TaxID=2644261 RepID=UPI00188CDB23|nr:MULTISPECIES: relaxase/mobilization nuclease domain-containing protein [unclassified Gluconobacter]MBF0849804.1 relaxase/mobilization nuclease domain-containing protein [Gluconobacter sp. R75690]MBF0878749.1 relaxase/mobilization nuclease domain-containing protein [Gluconobacter sp. R75828]
MILKSNPIRTSSGSGAIFHHLVEKTDENEHILLWKGRRQDVDDCIADAAAFHRVNAVQHFQVSSKEKLTDEQFADCITMLAREFGFQASDVCLAVIHTKTRHDGKADNRHCQFLVRTTNAETGKVLDVSHRYERQEKVARLFELKHGLELTKGRHNVSVYHAVPEEYRDRLKGLCEGPLPNSCLSDPQSRQSQRHGASPFDIKYEVREMFSRCESWQVFEHAMADRGWILEAGQKKPDVLILKDENGVFVGSLSRLLGLKKAELQQLRTDPEAMRQKGIASPGPRDTREPTGKGETPVDPHSDRAEDSDSRSDTQGKTGSSSGSSIPSRSPNPLSQKPHWLGPIAPLLHASRSTITEGMSHAEIQSVIDFNAQEAERDGQLRELLHDQKRFAALLTEILTSFQSQWQTLPPEPYPDLKSRDASVLRKTQEQRLDPARQAWKQAKEKASIWNLWNTSDIQKARDTFEALLHRYGYDRHEVGKLDLLDEDNFAYAVNWMAERVASGRERQHRAWQKTPEVRRYLTAKAGMERLVAYLKATKDVELLLLARTNPEEALKRLAALKENERHAQPVMKIQFPDQPRQKRSPVQTFSL